LKVGKKKKTEILNSAQLKAFMAVVMASIGDLGILIEYKKFD